MHVCVHTPHIRLVHALWSTSIPLPIPLESGGIYDCPPSPEPPISGKISPLSRELATIGFNQKCTPFPGFLGKSSRDIVWDKRPYIYTHKWYPRKWEHTCGPWIRAGGGGGGGGFDNLFEWNVYKLSAFKYSALLCILHEWFLSQSGADPGFSNRGGAKD